MPIGPLCPTITPNLAGYSDISPFQQLSAAFVHICERLDLRLQALNDMHYPNRCLAGFCYCQGRLSLVTDVGVEMGNAMHDQYVLENLGKQQLKVCTSFGLLRHDSSHRL